MRIPRVVCTIPTLVVVLVCGLPWGPTQASAQGGRSARLLVQVSDESTGQPIANALIRIGEQSNGTLTDARGGARLEGIRPGSWMLEVSRFGYAMERVLVTFEPNATVEAEIALAPQAVEVEGVAVTSWGRNSKLMRQGFYDRQRMGTGSYLSATEFERFQPKRTVDIVRRLRGFHVAVDRGGRYRVKTNRGEGSILGECNPDIYLDGVRIHRSVIGDDLDVIDPEHILAVEGYAGPATIPTEYNLTGTACGVLLIWSR